MDILPWITRKYGYKFWKSKSKVMCMPQGTMRSEETAPLILNLGIRHRWVVSFMPQATLLCLGETDCTKPVGNEMEKASQPVWMLSEKTIISCSCCESNNSSSSLQPTY